MRSIDRKGATERVLLIDGNWMMRRAVPLALRRAGYEVIEAVTPMEGIAVMAAHKGAFDVVMTEVFFRGEMNGPMMVKALREKYGKVNVIFSNGSPEETVAQRLSEAG